MALWGKTSNTQIPYATKFPILLPKPSHCYPHCQASPQPCTAQRSKGNSPETRSKYWIPGGRSFTRKILFQCVTCRRFEGLPFTTPPPPPLPECRVKEDPAFSFTGVDFAGPLFVRTDTRQSYRSAKIWIALFTCYVTELFIWKLLQVIHTRLHPLFETIHGKARFAQALHFRQWENL